MGPEQPPQARRALGRTQVTTQVMLVNGEGGEPRAVSTRKRKDPSFWGSAAHLDLGWVVVVVVVVRSSSQPVRK